MEGKLMEVISLGEQVLEDATETIPLDLDPVFNPVEPTTRPWTINASENLYRITGWGEPYFSINAAGHVTVSPQADHGRIRFI